MSEPALESVNSFQQSLGLLSITLQSPVAQRKSLTNVLVLSVSLEEEAVPSPRNTINVTNTVIIIQSFSFSFSVFGQQCNRICRVRGACQK